MKKGILTLALTLFFSILASAQITIQMEKDGGVYKVPCSVNGVKMKFIFDTGASSVCLSQSTAQFLFDGDYISASDIKGSGKSQIADGSIVNHTIINLHDIEIAGLHIYDVEATVIEGQNAPLLLGQSAIQKLGYISINGNQLIINEYADEDEYTDEQIDRLIEDALDAMKEGNYYLAIENLITVERVTGLTLYGYYHLAFCYCMTSQIDECIATCKKYINKAGSSLEEGEVGYYTESIYSYLERMYRLKEDYKNASLYCEKKLSLLNKQNIIEMYPNATFVDGLKASTYNSLGTCYEKLNDYFHAEIQYLKAIEFQCKSLGITLANVDKRQVVDNNLGMFLFDLAWLYYNNNQNTSCNERAIQAAKCGYGLAIEFCDFRQLNYMSIKETNNTKETNNSSAKFGNFTPPKTLFEDKSKKGKYFTY